MRAMRRQMIYTVIIVLAFVVFRLFHHGGPMKLPTDAIVQGSTVQVPLTVAQTKQQTQRDWSLYERPDKRWLVVTHDGRQTVSFLSEGKTTYGATDSASNQTTNSAKSGTETSGTNYATGGQIQFNGETYTAQIIHVNPAQTNGYIIFRSFKAPATGNLTASTTKTGASANS